MQGQTVNLNCDSSEPVAANGNLILDGSSLSCTQDGWTFSDSFVEGLALEPGSGNLSAAPALGLGIVILATACEDPEPNIYLGRQTAVPVSTVADIDHSFDTDDRVIRLSQGAGMG